jgi:hypothetical protein
MAQIAGGTWPAQITTGEKPYLIARVGLNWEVLLQAAPEVEIGSGGLICISHVPDFINIPLQ